MQKNTPQTSGKKFAWPKISWKHPVVLTLLVILIIFTLKAASIASFVFNMMAHPRPAPLVTSAKAKAETWPQIFSAVAQLKSENGTLLKAEMAGTLKEINVQAGQEVKAGDLLMVIDADAERAAAKLAELTYNRAKDLRAQSVNTQNDLDQAEATYLQAKAALDKKEIRAPFDGVVGIPQVFLGQYITVGTPLIAVESRKTIYADFGLPQNRVASLEKGAEAVLTVDAFPSESFKGKVEGVDPRVDDATLTVAVRAAFENAEGKLLSGMFGTVHVTMKESQTGLAVPASAIVYSAYGNIVYVLAEGADPQTKKKALLCNQAFVKVLATQGDWVLVSGLKDGDEVVTQGHMKLRNGSPVRVDNGQSLPADKAPKVQES